MSRVVNDEPTRRRRERGGTREYPGAAVKNGWPTKTLDQVCEIINGGTPKTGVREYWDGNHLWITPAEMGKRLSPHVSDTERKITDLGLRNSSARMLPPNSVILSSRAPIGHLVINTEPMATNQGCKGLIPGSQLQHKFLYYYLSSIVDLLNLLGTGATFKELSGGKLKEVTIPLPPLPEQQRIVGILDETFEGIAAAKTNAEKNLQNARALFESHLQSVFTQHGPGWVEKPLGSFASFRNGINYTKDSKGERVKIVGVRNFQKHFSAPLDNLDTVTIDGQLSELDSLRQDDILTVRSNGNIELIGRCILVGEVTERLSHSGFTIRIRLSNGEVLPRYVCHFMKSASSRKLLTEGGTGTNIKSLNQGILSALAIPFPPISVQKVLVEKLKSLSEETQRLASLYERKLAALEELKKSLLHQAFTGQI